jgi:hypothetical protein
VQQRIAMRAYELYKERGVTTGKGSMIGWRPSGKSSVHA